MNTVTAWGRSEAGRPLSACTPSKKSAPFAIPVIPSSSSSYTIKFNMSRSAAFSGRLRRIALDAVTVFTVFTDFWMRPYQSRRLFW